MPDRSRQLAAIMFTDIVGYSKLMGEDEEKAFDLLKKNRQVHRPLIELFNGRWLKEIGDGVLASFNTTSDAVYCAGAIQKACKNEPDLSLRIGIHQGEVVFEGEDVFGDGVNIASRLEPLASVGGIMVSESVHNNMLNKKGIESEFVREENLKNVKQTVKIYQVKVDAADVLKRVSKASTLTSSEALGPEPATRRIFNPIKVGLIILGILIVSIIVFRSQIFKSDLVFVGGEKRSIGVMPFQNLSDDKSLNYFSSGIREEITTELIRVKTLDVFASGILNQFDETVVSVLDFGKEHNIDHLLIGSIRTDEDRNRIIDTKLLHTPSGKYLWASSFKESEMPVTALQNAIAKKVVEELHLELSSEERSLLNAPITQNREAYDLYLQGTQYFSWNGDSIKRYAIAPLSKAVELDPKFAKAYAALAACYVQLAEWSLEPPIPHQRAARKLVNQALAYDPNDPKALQTQAEVQKNFEWDFEAAEQSSLRSIEINPRQRITYIFLLVELNRKQEALTLLQEQINDYPETEEVSRVCLAWLHDQNGDFAEGNRIIDLIDEDGINNLRGVDLFFLAEHYALQQESKQAIYYYEMAWINNPALQKGLKGHYLAKLGRIEDAKMEKSELLRLDNEKYISPVAYAMIELGLGNLDGTFKYLDEAYVNNDSWIILLRVFSSFQDPAFKADRRYSELLQRVGLPL